MEYRELLHHVTTRWLTLFPCIERILNSWLSLISYFRSLPDNECAKQIKTLLYIEDDEYENTPENEIPEIYLLFCNSLLKLFQDPILVLESDKITIIDIYEVVSTLLAKLEERQTKHYFGYLVTQKLKNIDPYQSKQIENNFVADKFDDFVKIIEKIPHNLELDMDCLFDDTKVLNQILDILKTDQSFLSLKTGDKWLHILQKTENVPSVVKLMSYM
jgi:hypothetical protein